jgi:hypothetical protein
MFSGYRSEKYEIQIPEPSATLVFASVLTWIGGVFVLIGFACPYWLVSWEGTFSPFVRMGLWEFCFNDYRHPHFQFDKLFNGCHYVFSEEYRIIREWLLPGWLMVVQAFYTLAFISTFSTQIVLGFLVTRWPLKFVLSTEMFMTFACCCANGASAFLLFLSVAIFGGQCYRRDWVQYPNFNYMSWGYAFACLAMFIHAFAALALFAEYKSTMERDRGVERDRGMVIPMHPQGGHSAGGSGASNPGSDVHHFV